MGAKERASREKGSTIQMDPKALNLVRQERQIYFKEAAVIQTTTDDERRPIKANLGTEGNG